MINYKKYFKEMQDEYKYTVNDYKKFEKKLNEKNRRNLLFSLKLLSNAINKLRASIKNIYFGVDDK